MARKHPHKLALIDGRIWRCVLDDCSFFVHLGLAHVIVGKRLICWDCENIFVAGEMSTNEPKPKCNSCRIGINIPANMDWDKYMKEKIERDAKKESEEDQIEVIPENEEHAPDCDIFSGGDCTCRNM